MIEKILTNVKWHQLKKVIPDDQNVIDQMITKTINELIDVVNEQQKQIDKMSCAILDLATPNGENKALESIKAESKTPVDPYAEQRKWVGKLCWFSQIYGCYQHIAILKRISESGLYVTDDGELHYAYCEPVKSDDDIIYKGE